MTTTLRFDELIINNFDVNVKGMLAFPSKLDDVRYKRIQIK